jgi:YaiO family outer membrane protein
MTDSVLAKFVGVSITAMLFGLQPVQAKTQVAADVENISAQSQPSQSEQLEKEVANSPPDSERLQRLASVYAAEGDLASAKRTIDRALALFPDDNDVKMANANILLWQGRLKQSRLQADDVARQYPDYPGLAEFRTALERVQDDRAARLIGAAVNVGVADVSFPLRNDQTWTTQVGSASFRLSDSGSLTTTIDMEQREQSDVRLVAEYAHRLDNGFVSIGVAATPNADFREKWSVRAAGKYNVSRSLSIVADGKLADYSTNMVVAVGAGLEYRPAPDFFLTARTINLFGGGENYRFGGVLRGDYRPEGKVGFFVLAAEYPDAEADGTRQLRSFAGGMVVPLGQGWTLRLTGEDDRRENSYHRRAVNVGIAWRFGGS